MVWYALKQTPDLDLTVFEYDDQGAVRRAADNARTPRRKKP